VWAGFVSGYKPAADVSKHVNQASSFIRIGVPGGKILCGTFTAFSVPTTKYTSSHAPSR